MILLVDEVSEKFDIIPRRLAKIRILSRYAYLEFALVSGVQCIGRYSITLDLFATSLILPPPS